MGAQTMHIAINFMQQNSNLTSIHRHPTPPSYRNAVRASRFTVQPPRFDTRPIMAKRDDIHKTGST